MNKKSRLAAIVGVVCGAELVVVAVIGGAGFAALVSIEAAIVFAVLAAASFWIVQDRRRKGASSTTMGPRTSNVSPPQPVEPDCPAATGTTR